MDIENMVVTISVAAQNVEQVLSDFRQLFKEIYQIAENTTASVTQTYAKQTDAAQYAVDKQIEMLLNFASSAKTFLAPVTDGINATVEAYKKYDIVAKMLNLTLKETPTSPLAAFGKLGAELSIVAGVVTLVTGAVTYLQKAREKEKQVAEEAAAALEQERQERQEREAFRKTQVDQAESLARMISRYDELMRKERKTYAETKELKKIEEELIIAQNLADPTPS